MTENNKNFVNYHVLISHSPSCLNRDDMNMQKSAIFGGVRRVRISSQSLKRAMRKSDYYRDNIGFPSDRTRELGKLKEKYTVALKGRYSEELINKTLEWISGTEGIAKDTRTDAVAPWAVEEVARFCEAIQRAGDDADTNKLKKQIKKDAKPFKEALSKALDIALSGRMATSGLMTSIDGALAISHVITTHAVDSDVDWFAAVDDLVEEGGDVGAGHLSTQEFSSGVFYRYASLNIQQLQENLGGANRKKALEIAAHVLHMMATIVPAAKQQSFAAHNPADMVMVSFGDIPISLANAFEKPVAAGSAGGYLDPSITALINYWTSVHKGYGLNEQTAVFRLNGPVKIDNLTSLVSLQDLKQWVKKNGVRS